MSRRLLIAAIVAAVIGLGGGVFVNRVPAVAATVCPGCYGLEDLGDGIWAESDDPRYAMIVRAARGRVEFFWKARAADPKILFCATDECYRRIGGGPELGRSVNSWALLISPDGATETGVTHELQQAEFHLRLGAAQRNVPDWFDEGLAALVASDDRYLLPPARRIDRCRIPYVQALPVVTADWARATSDGKDWPYWQAACLVSRWAYGHGNGYGARNLISRLENGATFDAVVRTDLE